MLPFRNQSFVGTIINAGPLPEGVNETYWFRWDLSSNLSYVDINGKGQYFWTLDGTFVNLYNGVLERPLTTAGAKGPSVCHPALIQSNATSAWFHKTVGNGTNIKFYWFASMHSALDSQLVPHFSNENEYMASLPNPAMLLASNVNLTGKPYNFLVHGTPTGVLHYFNGRFSRQLPATGCGVNRNRSG